MKVKMSVTLSDKTLREVDKLIGKRGNRSAFIELAVRDYVLRRQAERRDARDKAIINAHADEYNRFMDDVLRDQALPDADT